MTHWGVTSRPGPRRRCAPSWPPTRVTEEAAARAIASRTPGSTATCYVSAPRCTRTTSASPPSRSPDPVHLEDVPATCGRHGVESRGEADDRRHCEPSIGSVWEVSENLKPVSYT